MEGTTDNKKKILIGIFCVVGVFAIAICVLAFSGNRNIYLNIYDKTTKLIDEAFEETKKVSNEETTKIGLSGKASFDIKLNDELLDEETEQVQEIINQLDFKYLLNMNIEEKFIQVALDALKEDEELLGGEVIILEDKAYIKMKDVMDEYYETELEEAVDFEIDTEQFEIVDDIEVLYEIAKEEIRKQLNSDNIKIENDEIRINGDKTKVKKHVLTINQEVAYETVLAILDKIVNKEEALEAMTNIMNNDSYTEYEIEEVEEDLKETMDSLKEELDDLKETDEEDKDSTAFVINVYTKGFNKDIVRVEMGALSEDKFEAEFTLNITELEDKKAKYVLEDNNGNEMFIITIQDKGKDTYNIEIEYPDYESKLIIDGVIKDNKIDVTYIIKEDSEIHGSLFIETKNKSNNIKFAVDIDEIGEIGVELEVNTTDKVTLPDVSNSTPSIDEDIQEKLMEKITEVCEKLEIDMDSLMNMSNGVDVGATNDDYDYDFDYDFDDTTYDDYDYDFDYDFDDLEPSL